jgi:5'-nucleotidase
MSLILVTNDDGWNSRGIVVLAKALQNLGDVYIVAPEGEQSAVGHALTLHRPLKIEKVDRRTYCINGTPTDCVILGVNRLLPRKPNLIVSGINHGGNMGDDVTYSGTVAAAFEGTLLNIPSIAISFAGDFHGTVKTSRLQVAANCARKLGRQVLRQGLPPDTFLNVNVPDGPKVKGMELTKQGKRVYDNSIQEISDPRGKRHYWIGGGAPLWEPGEDTDIKAVRSGFISVTPVHLDLTNYKALEYMKEHWKM